MEVSLANLKIGMTIYCAMTFDDDRKLNGTTIVEYEVGAFPIIGKSGAPFMEVKLGSINLHADFSQGTWLHWPHSYAGAVYQAISLQDNGIIPNNYNHHKTFDTLTSAQDYIDVFHNRQFKRDSSISISTREDYDRAMRGIDL